MNCHGRVGVLKLNNKAFKNKLTKTKNKMPKMCKTKINYYLHSHKWNEAVRVFLAPSATCNRCKTCIDGSWWDLPESACCHSAMPLLFEHIVRMVWKRQPQDLEQHSSEWTCAINCTETHLFKPFMSERALHLAPENTGGAGRRGSISRSHY